MNNIEKQLRSELVRLQNIFNTGHDLRIKYVPNETRYNENNKQLAGEVQGDLIIIYSTQQENAIRTLYHEFVEYLIAPILQDYLEIINTQNKLIHRFIYKKREDIIERICDGLGG